MSYKKKIMTTTKVSYNAIIFCGRSGSGKDTMMNMLLKKFPTRFQYSIGYTTRPIRKEEIKEVTFHYLSNKEYFQMKNNGEFILSPTINGNHYGTKLKDLMNIISKGKIPIMILNVPDTLTICNHPKLNPFTIFLTCTDQEVLNRLKKRGDSKESISKRMKTAKKREILYAINKKYFKEILYNWTIEICFKQLCTLITTHFIPRRVLIFCGASNLVSQNYKNAAYQLGKLLALNKIGVVYGGGFSGLMKALAEGVLKHKGELIGVIPKFMVDNGWEYKKCTNLIITKDMYERKKEYLNYSNDCIIMLPGGIGTTEEFLEMCVQNQLGIINRSFCVLNTNNYYSTVMKPLYTKMLIEGFIRRDDLKKFYSTPKDVIKMLLKKKNKSNVKN